MVQQVRILCKSDDLSSVSGTHVKEEGLTLQSCSLISMCTLWFMYHIYITTHAHIVHNRY